MTEAGQIVIVGKGAFAQIFHDRLEKLAREGYQTELHPVAWKSGWLPADPKATLVFHCGSGRELSEAVAFCDAHQIPLVQASSGMDLSKVRAARFPLIDAPNISLPVIKLMACLESGKTELQGLQVTIAESHQASKKTVPSTAVKFAEILGSDPSKIVSVRDPKVQRKDWDVPEDALEGHAIHRIRLDGQGAELTLGTRILGRETYVHGLIQLYLVRQKLEPGLQSVVDLVHHGIL